MCRTVRVLFALFLFVFVLCTLFCQLLWLPLRYAHVLFAFFLVLFVLSILFLYLNTVIVTAGGLAP